MSPPQGSALPLPKVQTGGMTSPRTGPLSERQQMLFLKRMTDDSQDAGSKPTSPQPSQQLMKMTPSDKKVHKRNERGETPLHIAAIKGDIKQTKRLIKAGADVNVTDFAGWTPLHEASNRGWFLVAKQLLKAGANCNVQGLENDTPLHDAAGNGHRKLVELLLKHGANPMQPNKHGNTPVDVAMNPDMKRLLRKEVIASSSDSSSLDEIRSPTSPESNSSIKEEEDLHSSETEEPLQKLSKVDGNNTASTSRRALLKSPLGSDKLVSPRLFLKIQREQPDLISDRPKDYFSVRMEQDENKDLGSPLDSPVSSVESDLYDPQFESMKNLVTNPPLDVDGQTDRAFTSLSPNTVKSKNTMVSSTQSMEVDNYELDSFNKLSNLEPDSQSEEPTAPSSGTKYPLKTIETQPFLPQAEESGVTDSKDYLWSHSHDVDRGDRSHIPFVDSNHTRLKNVVDSSQNNGDSRTITSYSPSDNSGPAFRSGGGDSVSVITSSTSCSDRTSQNSSNFPRRNSISASNTVCSASSNNNVGISETGNNLVSSSGYKWDLRSAGSPRSEDSSNHSVKSESALSSSPAKIENNREVRNSPKLERDGERDRESRDSRPCSPKVPPLKIIFNPKSSSSSTQDSDSSKVNSSKKKLPYVVNPTREQELDSTSGQLPPPPVGTGATLMPQEFSRSASPSSRPSSQGSNAASVSKESDKGSVSTKDVKEKDVKEDKVSVDSSSNVESSEHGGEQKSDLKDNGSKLKDRDKESGKEKGSTEGDDKESNKPTRTLRSHTQALQQQEKQKQSTQVTTQPVLNKEKDKDNKSVASMRMTASVGSKDSDKEETGSISKGRNNEDEDLSIHPRKRKLRPKPEPPTTTTTEPQITLPTVSYEKPPNPFELYLSIRRQVHHRQRLLSAVAPKPPQGYKDYLMVTCSYVLQGNSASTLSVPMLSPPNSVTGPMRELFIEQEKARYKLALKHLTEREKLVLSKEQELVREHGKAARAQVNQAVPFSVCIVLRDEEIYNTNEIDQEEKEKNVRTRYNGRQFLSWLKDLDDKYEKIKDNLLLRHHQEAETLFAVQKLDWEWKMKDLGLCDHNTTPVIDDLHVPMVPVSDEFDLPST
ncbi:hypothetical protein FSP39_019448 [Pinctada imbricata]|uniref:Ankyrin repeat domain-containing protein 12 n=1 Tax=Pinctada imbricata TaxID=66713 RepID=A0AA88XS67_PINIB|nr:hypothetical protein FSP39_019448 [Pinctada imbricata]